MFFNFRKNGAPLLQRNIEKLQKNQQPKKCLRDVLQPMDRRKRTQFWGENKDDDRLICQILEGEKTATACPAHLYYLSDGDYDDGGYEKGDIVEVYDLKERLRCLIQITEVYEARFGEIPERLWKGENNSNAQEFKRDHLSCWSNNRQSF